MNPQMHIHYIFSYTKALRISLILTTTTIAQLCFWCLCGHYSRWRVTTICIKRVFVRFCWWSWCEAVSAWTIMFISPIYTYIGVDSTHILTIKVNKEEGANRASSEHQHQKLRKRGKRVVYTWHPPTFFVLNDFAWTWW